MDKIVSSLPAVVVSTNTAVEIDSKLPDAQVDVSKSITVEIQPETYVLTSNGMYTGSMTGSVPTWILDAIQQRLTTGDGNLMSVLDDMKLLLHSLQLGVNQTISQIENTNVSMSALETSLRSKIDANDAAILDVYATKVTPTEAQAIAVQAIGATFNGNVDAYIGNLASVYTNATSAIATDIHTLQVSYNDQTARIDTVEEVSLSKNTTIRSAIAPTLTTNPKLIIGDSWIDTTNNVTKSWNGSSWVDITNTNAQQAYTWSANASKLITAPDGSVTGWSFGDGSNTQSNFKIKAQNFSISDGITGYTPFSITGSDINFLGKVSFNSVTDVPQLGSTPQEVVDAVNAGTTTTINGGKITTGSVTANQIAASTITADRINMTSLNAANIVAKNVLVSGANGGLPIFSADGNRVVISNLKVLGTASVPGITKTQSIGIPLTTLPASSAGSTPPTLVTATYLYKPYECVSWTLTVICTCSATTDTSASRDLEVSVRINGSQIAHNTVSDAYNNNVATTGTIAGLVADSVYLEIYCGGHNVKAGTTVYGTCSCILTVQY